MKELNSQNEVIAQQIEEEKWKAASSAWIGRLNIAIVYILPKLIYRFNVILIKVHPLIIFASRKIHSKIHMHTQRTSNSHTNIYIYFKVSRVKIKNTL